MEYSQRNEIKIGDSTIGDKNPCYIIAEIGINHNGDLEVAKKLIDIAVDSGANAVKFQKRDLESIYQKQILENPTLDSQGTEILIDVLNEVEFNEEDFCTRLGESNIVRFPADYVDEGHVKTLGGKTISVVDFVKNCYRQINFHSMETVIKREENKETFKVNIFDLVYDHYALSSEPFVEFFGRLKEEFKDEIESIKIHPDITPEGKKSFIERYDALPQLVVWNDRELFFVLVKTKEEYLEKRDMDFLDEFVVSKKLFKAKIFRVTEKKRLQNREALEVKG